MILTQMEAYGLTLISEALVAGIIAPAFRAQRGRAALAAVCGSALTHPIVWLGAYALFRMLGAFTVPLLEAFAIAAEAVGYRVLAMQDWRRALLASAIVNGASWGLGVLLQS